MADTKKFTVAEITEISKALFADLAKDLPDEIRCRLKAQRTAQQHGSETRMFQFYFYDAHQPQVLDFHHFGYTLIYDPALRYHPKPCIARFYVNRHRMYDKKEDVIPALWEAMRQAEKDLYAFDALENEQMIGLFRMFHASSLKAFHDQAYQAFLELIPYWHSRYAAVVNTYGAKLTKDQIREVIAGRTKFQPSGPRSLNSRPEYRRHVPPRLRELVFERDGRCCLKCGARADLHADHIKPVADGGLTILDNLQTLCAAENLSKGNRESIDYRKRPLVLVS